MVIDHIRKKIDSHSVGLAYFYFNYQDRKSQSAENVLASLLRQLAMSKPDIPAPVIELHKRIESQQRHLQQQDFEQAILLISAEFDATLIVIDAFDECENEARKDLLRSLAFLHREPSIRLFLTSRPHSEQEIARKLGTPLKIEIGAKDSDLRAFLSSKIDDSDNFDVIDEEFQEEIIIKVTQAAHRM